MSGDNYRAPFPFNQSSGRLLSGSPRKRRRVMNIAHRMQLVVGPLVEPVTVADVKEYARIDSADEDSLIADLIVEAREKAEEWTRRAFITQERILWFDETPCWDYIKIPRPILQTTDLVITSYAEDDTPSVFAATNYHIATQRMIGRVTLKNGSSWPTDIRSSDGMSIEYKCGYGDTAADVPGAIKRAIIRICLDLLNNRTDVTCTSTGKKPPLNAMSMLTCYRVPKV